MPIGAGRGIAPVVQKRPLVFFVLEITGMLDDAAGLTAVGKPDIAIFMHRDGAAEYLARAFPDRLAEKAVLCQRVSAQMPDLVIAIGFSPQRRALDDRGRRIEGIVIVAVAKQIHAREAPRMNDLKRADRENRLSRIAAWPDP